MRERFCRSCRGWHRDGEWPRECAEAVYGPREAKNEFPIPFVRRDHMDALWHPGDGKEYTSRSDYDQVTREKGLLEIGNEDISKLKPDIADDTRTDVIEAYNMVSQGYKPNEQATTQAEGWTEIAP